MLSLAHGFLFIHIPKTAGNSVQRALLPYSEDRMVLLGAHQDGIERFEIRSPMLEMHKHLTLSEYRDRLPASQFDGLFKFHCIRNPWDRCVSFFFSPHRGQVRWSPEAFEAFIRDKIEPAHHFLALAPNDEDPFGNTDAVIRFENLTGDFADLCQTLGLGKVPLPWVNASRRTDYRTYFKTDALVELVARKFAPEIRAFGYRFDP